MLCIATGCCHGLMVDDLGHICSSFGSCASGNKKTGFGHGYSRGDAGLEVVSGVSAREALADLAV